MRTTAFIFVLIANTIMLAHAVVPHHHHQQQACIVQTHCKDDTVAHKHNTPEHSHKHNDDNNPANCLLKQVVVLPSHQGKHIGDGINCCDNHPYDFLCTLTRSESRTLIPDYRFSVLIPDYTCSWSAFITASCGLRAPPAV